MSEALTKLGVAGSVVAAVVATCCVLPMALMLVGLGGTWVAVFGKIAAAGYYVGAASIALIVAAWIVALRRQSSTSTFLALSIGLALVTAAWLVMIKETAINDFLISQM